MLINQGKDKGEFRESAGATNRFTGAQAFPASKKLDDAISVLKENTMVHWVSDGDWSMHDLLTELLNMTGPARVHLSSYSFSEFPARLLCDFISSKIITELHCLIDKRLDVRSASALAMIQNMATRVRLIQTHAKVTVVDNDSYKIVVIGSANYTTNKRYECGVIIREDEAADFHLRWINEAFNKNENAN